MTIKKGDLVMIVRPTLCCHDSSEIGQTFVAAEIFDSAQDLECEFCHDDTSGLVVGGRGDIFVEIERLKKIDPPADGDSLPTRKDMEVPA